MRAFVLKAFGDRPRIETLREPASQSGSVLIRVTACSLGTGEHLIAAGGRQRYAPSDFVFPHILGFQPVGLVAEDAAGWRSGERIVVNGVLFCGRCPYCLKGRQNLCVQMRYLGLDSGLPGGFAEYIRIPATNLHRLPEDIDDVPATAISEIATAVSAAHKINDAHVESIYVIGFGRAGSAFAGVVRARFPAADVTVFDINPAGAELASRIGVKFTSEMVPTKRDFEVVFDSVGAGDSIQAALQRLRPGGKLIVIGTKPDIALRLSSAYYDLIRNETTIVGSVAKTPSDFAEAIRLSQLPVMRDILATRAVAPTHFDEAWATGSSIKQALVWDEHN